jgi:hypothetical protein
VVHPKRILPTLLALTLLVSLALVFLVHTVIPAAQKLSSGFLAYYVGAQIIREGEPGERLYDDQQFAARVMQVSEGTVTDVYLSNPPTLAVAWLPFSYLPVLTARRVWIGFSALFLCIALLLVAQEFAWSREPWAIVALSALFTLPVPVREQFVVGQMYAFLLLLHVIGWRAYIARRDAIAGVALGLAMVLKISGWPIGLLFVARRRWSAVGWTFATAAAAVVITLPLVGIAAWRTLFTWAIPYVMHWPAATLTAYQDTTGFWQHLFRYDAQLNPTPIVDAPTLAGLLTLGTTVVACLALIARHRTAAVDFAAAVALTELLSPAAEQYQYIVLLVPLAVLWREVWLSRSNALAGWAIVATFLFSWPIAYKAPHPAYAFLSNYPRLIGGWMVFATLLYSWRAKTNAPPLSAAHV